MPYRPPGAQLSLAAIGAELKRAAHDLMSMSRAYLPPAGSTLALILMTLALVNVLSLLAPSITLCTQASLASGELWRLAFAPWLLPRSGALWPLLLLVFISYQASGLSTGALQSARPFWRAGVAWVALSLLNLLLGGVVWPIMMSGAMWCWFGEPLRALSPTSRSTLQRGLLVSSLVGVIAGGLYLSLLSAPGEVFMGDAVFIRPLLTAWGYRAGPHRLPLLKIRGSSLKWVILAFCLFEVLLIRSPGAFAGLSATLALMLWREGAQQLITQLTSERR